MEDVLITDNNNNNDVYEFLQEKFEGTNAVITQLDNGGYHVTNWGAANNSYNELYFPPNFTSNNVSIISYLPGSGGHGRDGDVVRDMFSGENPPNAIVSISGAYSDNGKTLEQASALAEEYGLNVTNVTLQSFSASGGVGFERMCDYVESHPDVQATIIAADGYGSIGSSHMYSESLAANGISVVFVNNKGCRAELDNVAKIMGENGVEVYIINSENTAGNAHCNANDDAVSNGLLQYTVGLSDELNGPNLAVCNYTLRRYDPENSDADKYGFVYSDNFEVLRQENSTFGYTLERLESNPFDSGTIASDMYQVVNSINGIRNTISTNTVQMPTCNSTSTIPGSFAEAETSLIGISSDLNSTIYKETQVISSIAQTFYDMDRERTNAANQLSNGNDISFDETQYYDVLNQLINVDISGEMHFGQFLFSPGSHIEGNSGKLCASDISSMLSGGSLSGPLHENLENERVSARNTKKEIDNLNTMISSGTNFQGDIWKAVSSKLDEYSSLMDLRIDSADTLEKAMVEALTLIQDYMGDYEELDDSKLPELRERVEQIKKSIIEAQNIIDATHTVTRTYEDDRGGTSYYYVTEYVYSASARQSAKAYITQATATLREVEREIVKLEGLPIILSQAEQIVNDALSEIYNKYGIKVSNVVCGKEVSYIPPTNTTYTAPEMPKYNPWTYIKQRPEGKLKPEDFYRNQELREQYGDNYDDYLNGVTRENNPMYNESMEDKGIEPGQSLNDKIFEDNEDEIPEEAIPEDEETTDIEEPDTEVPDTEKPVETPQQQRPSSPQTPTQQEPQSPSTPSQPSEPNTPSEPSEPEQPSEPSTPSEPSEPEQPSEPDTPSEPSEPEQPSEPSTPSEPSEPEQPSEPTTPSQPSEPEQSSEPSEPSTPSTPSHSSKPSTPSIPITPDDVGDAGYTDTPIIPDEVYPEDGDLAIDENISQEIPPIVEIPDNNDSGNDIVDITPPGNDEITNSEDKTDDLIKTVGIISGVGAAVGAAALGAHTISKAKKNDMYED